MVRSRRFLNPLRFSLAAISALAVAAAMARVAHAFRAATRTPSGSPLRTGGRVIAMYPGIGVPNSPNFSSSSVPWPSSSTSRSFSSILMNDQSSTPSSPSSSLSSTPLSSGTATTTEAREEERRKLIRQEGGPLAFNTKYGALNPYGIYYGLVSILLGLPWFVALTACQVFYAVTRNRIDPQRRVVNFITQIWGVTLMKLTRATPVMKNGHILQEFYRQKRPAMFVANHNSWMDIPFLGWSIGWRNYKLVSKKELGRVPILGKAIKVGGHIMVDRSDRKSQLKTLKRGIQYLKDGVHLCTYPEGTRSRSGRLGKFKNGAFKMAHKAGAPVIPISIRNAAGVMPPHWMFPYRPAGSAGAMVVVHPPIESEGKTEEELAAAVRASLISGLPDDQRPLNE